MKTVICSSYNEYQKLISILTKRYITWECRVCYPLKSYVRYIVKF